MLMSVAHEVVQMNTNAGAPHPWGGAAREFDLESKLKSTGPHRRSVTNPRVRDKHRGSAAFLGRGCGDEEAVPRSRVLGSGGPRQHLEKE